MKNPFLEDNGKLSIMRIQQVINNMAGIGLAFYCITKNLLTWQAVALIGSFVGVVNISKMIQKKYEAEVK
jgi:hypothetical protein